MLSASIKVLLLQTKITSIIRILRINVWEPLVIRTNSVTIESTTMSSELRLHIVKWYIYTIFDTPTKWYEQYCVPTYSYVFTMGLKSVEKCLKNYILVDFLEIIFEHVCFAVNICFVPYSPVKKNIYRWICIVVMGF